MNRDLARLGTEVNIDNPHVSKIFRVLRDALYKEMFLQPGICLKIITSYFTRVKQRHWWLRPKCLRFTENNRFSSVSRFRYGSNVCPIEVSTIADTAEGALLEPVDLVPDGFMEGNIQFLVLVTPILAFHAFEVGFMLRVTHHEVEVWVLLLELTDHTGRPFSAHVFVCIYLALNKVEDCFDTFCNGLDYHLHPALFNRRIRIQVSTLSDLRGGCEISGKNGVIVGDKALFQRLLACCTTSFEIG